MTENKVDNFTSKIIDELSDEEFEILEKGKRHWRNMDVLNEVRGGYVKSETIKKLIDKVIENTWAVSKTYYENKNK